MQWPRIRSRATTPRRRMPTCRPARCPAAERLEDRLCPSGYLLVDSFDHDSILRYNENTGAFVDTLVPKGSGGLDNPDTMILGPDHNLYVSNHLEPINDGQGQLSSVLRFNGTTGAFLGVIADGSLVSSPRGIVFGPDGNLYVAEGKGPGTVLRFDGTTGAFLGDFIPTGSGGLAHPTRMVFGPDGQNDGQLDLYIGSATDHNIRRYDGTTGAFKDTFVASGAGGLVNPFVFVFGPEDGDLYVSNAFATPGSILRFEGPAEPNPGAFLGEFVPPGSGGLNTPLGMLFGPDVNGDGHQDLYVASAVVNNNFQAHPDTSEVLCYDGVTGAFLKTFITPDSGNLDLPWFMVFTETDPMNLNYDGATTTATGAEPAAVPTVTAAPAAIPAGPIGPALGSPAPSHGPAAAMRIELAPVDGEWWDSSAQAMGPGPLSLAPAQVLDLALADLGGHPRHRRPVDDLVLDRIG